MNIPDAALLRKAIEIKTELEDLDRQLEELLHVSSIETSGETSARISKTKQKSPSAIPTKERHILRGNNPEIIPATEPSASHTTEVSGPSEHKDEAELSHEVVGMISSSKPHQETVLLVEEQSETPSSAPEKEESSSLEPTHEQDPHACESYYSSPEAVSQAPSLSEGLVDDNTAAPETSAETRMSFQNEPHDLVF